MNWPEHNKRGSKKYIGECNAGATQGNVPPSHGFSAAAALSKKLLRRTTSAETSQGHKGRRRQQWKQHTRKKG
jgi:hypothetical protein